VTHDDVLGELGRLEGSVRRLATSAMRSLFRTLKAHRLIFADPTVRIAPGTADRPPVLALDPTTRGTLLGHLDRPAAELTLLLAGVHALRRTEIRFLTLDAVDLPGGMLLVKGARRSLDALTLTHLKAWLECRRILWPATANPYLLVNRMTAPGVSPVSHTYAGRLLRGLGTTVEALRADRLLAHAVECGDPLVLARLFGVSFNTAVNYCAQVGLLDQPPNLAH
jgi:integrase